MDNAVIPVLYGHRKSIFGTIVFKKRLFLVTIW